MDGIGATNKLGKDPWAAGQREEQQKTAEAAEAAKTAAAAVAAAAAAGRQPSQPTATATGDFGAGSLKSPAKEQQSRAGRDNHRLAMEAKMHVCR